MNKKLVAILVVAVVITSVVAYNYFSRPSELEGTIKISGAFALYPMMVKWAEEYEKIYPKVRIEVSAGGAGKGMTDALSDLVDIGMVSREIQPEETQKGAFYVTVTKDAVLVTVNAKNPVLKDLLVMGISKETFYDIFVAGNITTWGQVIGKPEVTDQINVYTRSDACGAADNWAKYLGKKQEDLKGIGVYGDPGLLDAVKNDPLAIGYNNLGFAFDVKTKNQIDGISVVPIDLNKNGLIDPSEDFYSSKETLVQAILQGAYPTPPARNEYLVTKEKFTGITKDFVKWILTDGQKYVEEAGYVPLPTDILSDQLKKLGE